MMIFANMDLLLCISAFIWIAIGAHVHQRSPNKERIEDGFEAHMNAMEHPVEFDHEAILGSRDKANQFDELSPEESKRRLRILVTKGGMDSNGDGFVDKDELTNWVLLSFKSLAREDGVDRLEEEDSNDDGKVSWEEHLMDNFDTESSKDHENNELIQEDMALWKAADINKDGIKPVTFNHITS